MGAKILNRNKVQVINWILWGEVSHNYSASTWETGQEYKFKPTLGNLVSWGDCLKAECVYSEYISYMPIYVSRERQTDGEGEISVYIRMKAPGSNSQILPLPWILYPNNSDVEIKN